RLRLGGDEVLGAHAAVPCGPEHGLAVLVSPDREADVVAAQPMMAGEHVTADLLIDVAEVGVAVDVVDGGGDVEGAAHVPITTVHSPRGGCRRSSSTSSRAVPRWKVSWTLVNSRATTTGRSARSGSISSRVLARRLAASKRTTGTPSPRAASTVRRRRPGERGGKPRKTKPPPPPSPLPLTAAVTALGPGTTVTGIPARGAAATSRPPGSLN